MSRSFWSHLAGSSICCLALGLAAPSLLAAPDLTGLVNYTLTPSGNGASVTFSLTLANQGTGTCANTWWADFWATYPCPCNVSPADCNQASDANWEIGPSALPSGASVAKQVVKEVPASSVPYRYLLYLDSFGDFCAEGTETNNIICGEYTVSPQLQAPDLVVTACSADTDPSDPTMTLISVTVQNQGASASNVPVGLDLFTSSEGAVCSDLFNVAGDAWLQVPALSPSQSVTLTKSVSVDGGTHELVALINGYSEIDESTMANNCCNYQYEVSDRPDLLIPELSVVLQNGVPVFTGVVLNDGNSEIPAGQQYKLCFYYDRVDQPAPCETPDVEAGEGKVEAYVSGLPIGGEQPFAVTGGALPNGVYSMWARADCDCEILEADEKNNDAKRDLVLDVPGPDLQVKLFTAAQDKIAGKNAVRYLVLVTNAGTDPITDMFDLDLFFNQPTLPTVEEAPSIEEGFYVQGPPLGPGEFFQTEVTWERAEGIPDGTYTSWAVIDLFGTWWETNETNNAASTSVDVVTKAGPNLDLSEFRSKVVGNRVVFSVTVTNNGDSDVDVPFRIDLFRDREHAPQPGDLGDAFQEVSGLAAGQSTTWESEWEQAADGEYYAYAFIDSPNAIAEGNEADNVAGPRIVVVCSSCAQCDSDTYLTSACVCGEETVYSGFCCDGEWYALGCPSVEEPGPDASFPDGEIVEWEPPLKRSSSCAAAPDSRSNPGHWALLASLLVLLSALGRASRRRCG